MKPRYTWRIIAAGRIMRSGVAVAVLDEDGMRPSRFATGEEACIVEALARLQPSEVVAALNQRLPR